MKTPICKMCGEPFVPEFSGQHICYDCNRVGHPESLMLIIIGCLVGCAAWLLAWIIC